MSKVTNYSQLAVANKELAFQNEEKEKGAAELVVANSYLDNLIECANAQIVAWNPQYRITRFNRAFETLTGRRTPDVLGEPLGILFPPDQVERSMQLIMNAQTGEHLGAIETDILHVGGTVRTLLWSSAMIFAPDGTTLVATIAHGQDITDRKRAEVERQKLQAQLQQAQKMEAVGRLAGGVAHDFNNLLGAILGYGKFLRDAIPTGDPKLADLDEIIKAGERAVCLTRQLLAFSRKQVLKPQPLSPDVAVSALVKMLGRLIGEHIELKALLNAPQAVIMADPTQFDQVLMNLAVNARDAMPDGGSLTVKTETLDLAEGNQDTYPDLKPGRYAVVKISDTGSGLSAEAKEHLFEPFFTSKGLGCGTGLGLSTVYGIMKQSGGDLSVYSEPDKGTVFKLYFPLAEVKAEAGARKEPRPLPRAHGGEKILVVEDDAVVRSLTARMLEASGYSVLQAALPEKALDLCRDDAGISLMLTDVIMPQMSGWALAEKVHVLRPGLPIVFTSGYTDDILVGHNHPERDAILLEKPVTAENLINTVRMALDQG